jgi:hypothetical protein
MKRKMKTWVANGNNILSAEDMKYAIDSAAGIRLFYEIFFMYFRISELL